MNSESSQPANSLAGQLLIAMPGLNDPNFDHTVSYILEHNAEGAIGLVINRPIGLDFGEILDQLKLPDHGGDLRQQPVLYGGPVQQERGFVIYEANSDEEGRWESTATFNGNINVTTSPDILEALADGKGPGEILFVLGYAGWDAGQLDSEIADNAWLSVDASNEILFQTPLTERWEAAAKLIGIDITALGSTAGHA